MARGSRFILALLILGALPSAAEVRRIVILKVDGVPERLVEQYAQEQAGPGREDHSRLPWIERIFFENGTWLENFYTRGISLSAPSWSLLDTGRHLEIHGNVEYDRYTLRAHDYLNFFPFYLSYATSRHMDMPGVELLDEQQVPLLIDRFPYEQRFQSFQLFQRGVRWTTLKDSLKRMVAHPPRELFDEWQTGFAATSSVSDQSERDLIERLKDPHTLYLDDYSGEYDHVAHLTNDPVAQRHALEAIDRLVGRVWTAIARSPLADTTALVLISDHGMNTEDGVYSQGFNLVDWFNSAAGGLHNVITDRHPLTEFKLKGLDPFVSDVVTPSRNSGYLAGQTNYPTAVLDLDGNERASIGLRNNTLNILQILLDQMTRKRLDGATRAAALNAFFTMLERVRADWRRDIESLAREIAALRAEIEQAQQAAQRESSKWSREQRDLGLDKAARREASHLETWKAEAEEYERYRAAISRLLDLSPADFDPVKFKIEDVIPPRSLGPLNSIHDLQNYVAGPAAGGLALAPDGSLDFARSFQTVDYFAALKAIAVRNNVQKEVDPQPVDFVAAVVPLKALSSALPPEDRPDRDGIWLSGQRGQALILSRRTKAGGQELRYLPIAGLRMDASGEIHFSRAPWASGFPLKLWEDPQLNVPGGDRASWLDQWHPERDWLQAVHRTKYSNGIIGLTEELLSDPRPSNSLLDEFRERERELLRTDLLVLARDHWNFNVRGFNPGGNHGSFLRVSTHSVLAIAGGKDTGIPRGLDVETPYDSLSFVPTILKLMDKPEPNLPGPLIEELFAPASR